jgi:hypothetical protein
MVAVYRLVDQLRLPQQEDSSDKKDRISQLEGVVESTSQASRFVLPWTIIPTL